MFDFKTVESPKKINRDFILSKISEAQIFGYYHGPFKIGQIYCSKLRRDKNPSCGFYVSKSGKLIYNDLARKDWAFDCFAFVEKLYNLSFSDAIKKIASDFGLVTGIQTTEVKKVIKQLKDFDKSFKKDTRIIFSADKWNDSNLAYWKQYHITKQELEREGIYPIKRLFINDFPVSNPNNENRYALTLMNKGEMRTKIYAPGSETLRWITNIPLDVPFGMDTLKYGSPFCFVAKAQKDRIILMKFLRSVIASQNESEGALDTVAKKLLFNFPDNYLGWDPDEKGLSEMAAMEEKGFKPLHLPIEQFEKEGIKDYADLAKVKGLGAIEQFLKQNKVI
jgi:hypothetical protein